MKRLIACSVLLTIVFTLSACSVQRIDTQTPSESTGSAESSEHEASADLTTDGESVTNEADPPRTTPEAALYNMTHSEPGVREEYVLVSRHEDDMSGGRDLCVLGAFPSTEATLSGKNMGDIWSACITGNGFSESLRPGFLLEFDTPDGKCEKLILRPSDITDAYWDYIETYVYDDIHQTPGAWYSHLLDSEFTDETIITSVKITAGERIAAVKNLTLTVFLYEVGERDNVDTAFARANGSRTELVPNAARK